MTIYQRIRAAVPIGQAARRYGLTVSQGGMALCPFHHDTHPSLKLNEDYFFCFGCGATGDVIDFTAWLLGISQREAAQKLAMDFGLNPRPPAQQQNIPRPDAELSQNAESSQAMERFCICVLSDYLRLLRIWRLRYEPKAPGEEFHNRFVEACWMTAYVDHLLDCLLSGIPDVRQDAVTALTEGGKIYRLQDYMEQKKKEEEIIVQRKYPERHDRCA